MKQRTIYLGLLSFGFALNSFAQKPLNAAANENWVLKGNRSDEFNASRANNAPDYTKWNRTPENFQTWSWNNSRNVKESNGTVKLTMRRENSTRPVFQPCQSRSVSTTLDYTSGFLKSSTKGIYGYYEARIKGASRFPGVAPAFWLYSPINDNLTTPGSVRYSEIDIVEMQQRPNNVKHMDHNLHRILTKANGQTGGAGRDFIRPLTNAQTRKDQANDYVAPFDPRDSFHVYGCKVTQQQIIWYVDRKEVGRKPNLSWKIPMNVALSMGLRAPFAKFECNGLTVDKSKTTNNGFPTSMEVDYVRVWELNGTGGGNNNGGNNNGGNNCSNFKVWKKSTNYKKGNRVKLAGVLYRLKNNSKGSCRPGANNNCSKVQWAKVRNCGSNKLISNIEALDDISVFPNPASDIVTITAPSVVRASLINLQGQLIDTASNNNGLLTMDVSSLTTGLYILKIETNDGVKMEKLFIK